MKESWLPEEMVSNLRTLATEAERLKGLLDGLAKALPDPPAEEVNGLAPRSVSTARLAALELASEDVGHALEQIVWAAGVTVEELEREHEVWFEPWPKE